MSAIAQDSGVETLLEIGNMVREWKSPSPEINQINNHNLVNVSPLRHNIISRNFISLAALDKFCHKISNLYLVFNDV